ncbi:Pvc16 family protein [Cylindrospermum stagnale]|uniref:Pvc16 family protein n=1 Tax=Cylindrospermum stagnale TaxID=142864 RepID=UPI0012F6AD93
MATVTATLKYLLQEGVSRNGSPIEVTTLPPNTEGEGIPKLGVNLYLYRITPNLAMANSDLRSPLAGALRHRAVPKEI